MFEEIVESALDAVVGIDRTGRIIFWNSQAENTFGWKKEEVVGKLEVTTLIPERYRESHDEGMRRYNSSGEARILHQRLELSGIHHSGHEFPLELTVIPVGSQFYAFVRDITERVQKHDALLDIIKERDFFISVASHEIKTPLTSLKLRIQLLEMLLREGSNQVDPMEEVRKSVEVCSRQVDKLATMVNDLLDLAKIQARKMETTFRTFKLRNLLFDIVERMEAQIKSAAVKIAIESSEILEVRWDVARIEQVFVNLISNVLKYAPGKALEIQAQVIEEDYVRVIFCDNGPGISPENQKRLFNPFSRCGAKYFSGLGLGLFICKGIIEQHRGRIFCESQAGRGTKFILEIPRLLGAPIAKASVSF